MSNRALNDTVKPLLHLLPIILIFFIQWKLPCQNTQRGKVTPHISYGTVPVETRLLWISNSTLKHNSEKKQETEPEMQIQGKKLIKTALQN